MKNVYFFSTLVIIVSLITSNTNAYAANSGNPAMLEDLKRLAEEIKVDTALGQTEVKEAIAQHNSSLNLMLGAQFEGGNHPKIKLSWSEILGVERFELVFFGEAILDKETGLMWEQAPDITGTSAGNGEWNWNGAMAQCITKAVGARYGWRAPSVVELSTLLFNATINPRIPTQLADLAVGIQGKKYWSATLSDSNPDEAWTVNLGIGVISKSQKTAFQDHLVWCVRGGAGAGAY